jgi:hypothetical protein
MRMVAVKTAQVSPAAINRASFWTSVSVLLDGIRAAFEVSCRTCMAGVRHDYCGCGRVFREGATCDNSEPATAERDHTLIRASV